MRPLIVHYHLQPGGVTRIINSHVEAMRGLLPDENITVLTGEDWDSLISGKINALSLPELNYLDLKKPEKKESRAILEKILAFIGKFLHDDTVIHAHNMGLGKNPVLTYALDSLSEKGVPLFNHCHDFAEDGRPANIEFLKEVIEGHFGKKLDAVLYPDRKKYLYGALNSRDMARLEKYGAPPEKINFLPNPVHFAPIPEGRDKGEILKRLSGLFGINPELPLFTYPVRVIRRKNIGEFILLAHIFRDKANWAVTLSPQNPVEKTEHRLWKDFCLENGIKVFFDIGDTVDFTDIMQASSRCISTSIKEGFGMAFLEPWLFDVPVAGRDIPYLTCDFREEGLVLPSLYGRLNLSYNGRDCDFPELEIGGQMEFIKSALNSEDFLADFIRGNPELQKTVSPVPQDIIEKNRRIIMDKYSIKAYGRKLYDIYEKMSR